MAVVCKANPFFVGGGVLLDFRPAPIGAEDTGTYTILRAPTTDGTTPGPWTTIAQNADFNIIWIDVGDGIDQNGNTITGPLPYGSYIYQITYTIDGVPGTLTLPAVALAKAVKFIPDSMNAILIRVLEGAMKVVTMPEGMQNPSVMNGMPVAGLPPMPMVSVNEEIIQQTVVPIGQQVFDVHDNNLAVASTFAKRMWRISVQSKNVEERDFIRDYIIGLFPIIAKDLFVPLGRNNTHRFQAVSGSTSKADEVPGFYYADILYDFDGTFNTTLQSSYGIIEHITTTAFYAPNFTTYDTGESPAED